MSHHDPTNPAVTNTFQPDTPLMYATAIPLLVQELGLNIQQLRFIKAPQASDYFTTIDNNAPYSGEMLVASLNGLPLSTGLDPAAMMPRTDFAVLLWHALEHSHSPNTQAFHIADDEPTESAPVQDEWTMDTTSSTNGPESSATSKHKEQLSSLKPMKCSANIEPSEHSDSYVCQQMIDRGLLQMDDEPHIDAHEPILYAEAMSMLEHARSLINHSSK